MSSGEGDNNKHELTHELHHLNGRPHISHHLTLAAVSSLFAVTLIVILIFIYCKYRQNRRHRVDFVSRLVIVDSPPQRGLDPAVLNSLPVFAAAAVVGGGAPPSECSVCLANVAEEKAMVRLLPNCGHTFHVECVDTWLASHTTCPLCRAEVEPEPEPPEAQPTAAPVDEMSLLNAGGEVAEGKATRLSSFKRMLSRERSGSTRSPEMVIEP